MPSLIIWAALLSVVATSFAGQSQDPEYFESLPAVPRGWTKIGEPSPDQRIYWKIYMTTTNLDQRIKAISNPFSPEYGNYYSSKGVDLLFRPTVQATAAIHSWLQAFDIPSSDIHSHSNWIDFWAPISTAEKMLDTEFHVYGNSVSNTTIIRTLHYSLPKNVSAYIDLIDPTTYFGQPYPQRRTTFEKNAGTVADGIAKVPYIPSSTLNVTACNTTITPDCIRALCKCSFLTKSCRF